MSRRTQAKKRVINPDPIYRSRLVSMMISRLLQDGKKSIASKVFYESLEKMTGKNTASSDSRAAQPPSKNKNSTAAEGSNLGLSGSGPSKSQGAKGDSTDGRGTDVLTSGSSGSEAAPNITKNTNSDTFKVFQQAVLNVTPLVEVKSRRVGGSNYQVPLEVNADRGTALALRWIVQAARLRPGREMSSKLANEFMDASNKVGAAVRKRDETHKMAEANKAFANYRF